MFRFGLAITLFVVATGAPALSASTCGEIVRHNGAYAVDELYWRTGPRDTWKPVRTLQGFIRAGQAPRNQDISFAYVLTSASARSGVVSIKLRTEAIGPSTDAARVRIQRPAVAEACGPLGRILRKRQFDRNVATRIYENHHDPKNPAFNTDVDQFHFLYRSDAGNCIRTDANGRRAAFGYSEFASGPTDTVRRVDPPELETAGARVASGLRRAYGAVAGFANPSAAAEPPTRRTYYSQLQSFMRRYKIDDGEACVSFNARAFGSETATYITITDLDSYYDPYPSHWKVEWQ